MDEELQQMSKEQLVEEIKKLRAGIRKHRDSTGQDLCWHHPQLWSLLPEQTDPAIAVPAWPEFMKGCVRYRQSLEQRDQ
jgi:hypothetical protein